MQKYVLRRLALMIPTLVGLSMIVFLMVRIVPGDVVALIAGEYGAVSPETKAAILEDFGLADNIPIQYKNWLQQMLQGDLGTSLISGRSVTGELSSRLPVTFELGILSIIVSAAVAIPIGIVSAIRQNTFADYAGRSLAIGFLAAPNFWIAIMLITFASKYFLWGVPSTTYPAFLDNPIANLKFMAMPAILLGLGLSGSVMRYTRSAVLEVMRQDYVRTAHAKGLAERTVVTRHVLRNALVPVITVLGLQLPVVIGGTVIIESVYSIPGMGRYYISSINQLDFPVIQAINLVVATFTVFSILAVDLLYSVLNPRIRYS
ncbi:MAG: ABC transporter permease [Chloroflexi bacterium]|nr:ABC transporter permease [Chloroflexota bacterium]